MMQLNVYVPREKEAIVAALDAASKRLGRQKNDLVLEAIETYLARSRPELGTFHLGATALPPRDGLYAERWNDTRP